MNTKTIILIAAVAAGAAVVATQRKKIMALLTPAPTPATPPAGMPFGDAAVPPAALAQTVVTTQSAAQLINTTVTTLAGIAGLALTAMTLTEKRRSLAKA